LKEDILECIFGKEIHKECPVRKELSQRAGKDLSKWIKPKHGDEIEELFNRLEQALNLEYTTLAAFCDVCPFLSLYISDH